MAAFASGWLVQLGGVITDNYYNLRRHADDKEHQALVEALQQKVISLKELRRTIYACYGLAVLIAFYLVHVAGFPIVVVGIACIVASVIYSAGPFPLGDHGLGDVLFFVFFGIVSVMASFYVQAINGVDEPLGGSMETPVWPWQVLFSSFPIGALTTNILIIDNIRDLDYDRDKGEKTLAVIIGAGWSRVEFMGLLALAYAVPFAYWVHERFNHIMLLPVLSLPYALWVSAQLIRRQSYQELVPLTPQAGQVLLVYAILLSSAFAFS
ncbi:MAG: 1,4-dihydroxy-2-naphthoate octaprenyltransferase [Acidobacteria bacterium]|nr:1,4-dihydroxy-2-naphthoate octaprenyltransferase [Acidobacteriota bacterium]